MNYKTLKPAPEGESSRGYTIFNPMSPEGLHSRDLKEKHFISSHETTSIHLLAGFSLSELLKQEFQRNCSAAT